MATPLESMTVHGFKSIENLDEFSLGNLNVLIGANDSGKSNFVDFSGCFEPLPTNPFRAL